MTTSSLGAFFRTWRDRTLPEASLLQSSGYRRVPGLRREELAVMAGLSVDYYTRIEQGRETNPSPQILDALSRALNLTPDAKAHAYRLAGRTPPEHHNPQCAALPPRLEELLHAWTTTPAYIITSTLDVLLENDLAQALHSGFNEPRNLARMAFLEPAGRDFYVDHDRAAHSVAAYLRRAQGLNPHNPRLSDLLVELQTDSSTFRHLWNQHYVRGKTNESKQFRHPAVGLLTLEHAAFGLPGHPELELIVHHAPDGTAGAEQLALLGSLRATTVDALRVHD